MKRTKSFTSATLLIILAIPFLQAQNILTAEELLSLRSSSGIVISPEGSEALYTLSTPRGPNEDPGGPHSKVFKINLITGKTAPLFEAERNGSSPRWSPDGSMMAYLYNEPGEEKQIWTMPAEGGSSKMVTDTPTGVSSFHWMPDGSGIAFISRTPASEKEKELERRGYDFIYYEENLKNDNLFIVEFDNPTGKPVTHQLTEGVQVWRFVTDHTGKYIAAAISPKNLIDHSYMFTRVFLIDTESGEMNQVSENEGKLGNFAFSPDDNWIAYTASLNIHDHAVSQVFVKNLGNNNLKNLTPPDFKGHISHVNWKNNKEIIYYSEEGVWPKFAVVNIKNGKREIVLDSEDSGIIFDFPDYTADFSHFILSGSTPEDPDNLYYWDGKHTLKKLTDINPELKNKDLGKQEIIRYKARDGQEIEGLLIHPVDFQQGKKYPLIVYVHGGPESHHNNDWLSRYSTPAQVMAGKGYLVLFLNYRSSTGYGVEFGMTGLEDPAGTEFDDIADAIDYMIKEGNADPDRIGLAGGSYGGYASAWFATYYTKYVRAVCMFVGISDLISKRGTTDIPYEELYVHSGKKLEEQWQMNLERSPIYWAHQSKTATLIYGGAADTRVHPSQSLELYRRMKMNNHPAVRLVQYPGEHHGNRNQVGQIDVIIRQISWFDWYVRDLKPLDGPMPPLDISDSYGLDWDL